MLPTFMCIYYIYSFIFLLVRIYRKSSLLGIFPIKLGDYIFQFFVLKNKKGIK